MKRSQKLDERKHADKSISAVGQLLKMYLSDIVFFQEGEA